MGSPRPPWFRSSWLLLRTLLLVAALPLAGRAQTAAWQVAQLVAAHPDCYRRDFKYHPDIPNTNVKASSIRHCQALCHRMDGCAYFSYWPDSADCYFSDTQAEMQTSSGAVGGLGVCPEPGGLRSSVCTKEKPGNGFPGFTGKAANAAWPSGKQPRSLECWPRNDTGGYMSCKQVTILEDTENGWPGKCMNLTKRNGTFAQCAEDCKQNPLCSSWQTGAGGCWQGLGINCFVRVQYTPIRAQRVQHGSVRVLMDLKGWQIVGLAKSFDNSHGYFLRTEDAITACRKVCYSDIRCQYWQYTPRYGCHVEDVSAGFNPPWPLTTEWAYRSTQFALDCVAGEYIQHTCPPGMETPFAPLAQERLSSCMRMGYDYDPPDMHWQSATVEMGAESCQERCKSTKGCASFTYWPDGSCHLQDAEAVKTVAKDRRVISGPMTCEPPRPLAAQSPAQVVNHPQAAPVLQASPDPVVPEGEKTMAEIMVDITNLAFKRLSDATVESLSTRYTHVLAKQLGVEDIDIRRKPRGQENRGSVLLLASTYGSAVESSDSGTLMVAYTLNRPPTSTDVSRIRRVVMSKGFKQALVLATHSVVAQAPHMPKDQQEGFQFFNQHPDINQTEDIFIGLCQVHALTGRTGRHVTQEKSEDDGCGAACHWWPLAIGVLLLLCTGGVAAGVVYHSKKAKAKKKKRGAKGAGGVSSPQESTASGHTAMCSLDVAGTPLHSHGSAAGHEAVPLIGHMYPQPMPPQTMLPAGRRHEFYV